MRKINKDTCFNGGKITVAAILAILFSNLLKLQFAPTAGIITILSIQKTKKETFRTAGRRTLAFLIALVLAALCFGLLGFQVWAFALYLLLFSMICLYFGWTEAIAMDSVLITHFLTQQTMDLPLLINEMLLFFIGTIFGVFANLYLKRKKEEFEVLADKVDTEICGILKRMSKRLLDLDKSSYNGKCFLSMEEFVAQAKESAYRNYNNQLLGADYKEIDYIKMREQQIEVLKHIYESIKMVQSIPSQTKKIAALMVEIEAGYHKENTVEGFLQELEQLFREMEQEPLPKDREEFEARAVLFYIMKQLEEFLMLKKRYIMQYRQGGLSSE